ncbi:MAG: hypothetical protein IT426_08965 [Pirellulales bacterium]|nr:hypothetical protein [Pirellulales bacterium]
MRDPQDPLADLLDEDRRYKRDAYVFVYESLRFAHEVLGLGEEQSSEPLPDPSDNPEKTPQRHVTGQELCEAIRQYALHLYGYMAKTVLNSWGLHSTGDFGEIVFNLIRAKQMRKTPQDSRADFDAVFDFDEAFCKNFHIPPPV